LLDFINDCQPSFSTRRDGRPQRKNPLSHRMASPSLGRHVSRRCRRGQFSPALDSTLKILLFVLGLVPQVFFAVLIGMIHRRISASIKALEGFK